MGKNEVPKRQRKRNLLLNNHNNTFSTSNKQYLHFKSLRIDQEYAHQEETDPGVREYFYP